MNTSYPVDSTCAKSNKDKLIDNWVGVETDHSLIKSNNALGNLLYDTSTKKFKLSPVNRRNVHLLARATNPHLDGVNSFLKSSVLDYYFLLNHMVGARSVTLIKSYTRVTESTIISNRGKDVHELCKNINLNGNLI